MRFQATDDTNGVEIQGQRYDVDADGGFNCDNTEHQQLLRQLGFHGESDPAPVAAPAKAEEPSTVPEGYLDPETVTVLVEENEDMRQGLLKLQGELASAKTVEDLLRDRIQELEGQIAAAATEKATEGAPEGEGGADAPVAEKTTEKAAPAAPIKKGK